MAFNISDHELDYMRPNHDEASNDDLPFVFSSDSPPATFLSSSGSAPSTLQSIALHPLLTNSSFALLKHLLPINGDFVFVAPRGDGCEHIITACLDRLLFPSRPLIIV